ncbi:MAG: hypothetical protein AAGA70_02890 [Pseudomonadota bacterium]
MTQDHDPELLIETARFVEDTPLPDFHSRRAVAGIEEEAGAFPNFDAPELAVTVGSQIASFSGGIDGEVKEAISNAFLFAQQVADKQIETNPQATSTDWYAIYVDVMSRIGWIREEGTHTLRKLSGAQASVHDEIIPIVTAALGPAGASATIIQVLDGLKNMDAGSPWITLFNRTSQRASANQFQVAHVDEVDGTPRIKLIGFELNAERAVNQVLFFKFSTDRADLRHFETKMSVDQPIFSEVAPIVKSRLAERARDFILAIDL